jgi:hypothetical protein
MRYVGPPLPEPQYQWREDRLYTLKQTPRGSVVVLGDEVVFEYEMSHKEAQEAADWLNDRRKNAC